MKISDETKVGVLAAFGLAILIIGYNFLRGKNLFEKKKYYYTIYNRVEGLNASDPVTLNGLPIGKVASLALLDDSTGKSIAKIHLVKDIKIPKNSAFQLYSSDLLGEKAVQLVLGDSKELAKEGDTLSSGKVSASLTESVNEQIAPVKQKAENLLLSIDTVIESVKVIIRGGQIENSMASIEKATNEFEKVAKNIDTLISTQRATLSRTFEHIENITANLDSNSGNITRIFNNLAQLSDSLSQANLKQTVGSLQTSLDELQKLLAKINSGEGSMGLLVNDRKLYDNLEKTTRDLDLLLTDLKANPKRYVHFSLFGGGEKSKKKDMPVSK